MFRRISNKTRRYWHYFFVKDKKAVLYTRAELDLVYKFAPLSDVGRKHRAAIIGLSFLLMIVNPSQSITLGVIQASGAGLSFDPPITLNISFILILILVYRLASFAAEVFTDPNNIEIRSSKRADEDVHADENYVTNLNLVDEDGHLSGGHRQSAYEHHKFEALKMKRVWEILLPVISAATSLFWWLIRAV